MTRTHDAHYRFNSQSRPGQVWTVQYVETATGWELRCDCTAAQHGRTCWHVKAAGEHEGATAPKPARRPAVRPEFERQVAAYLDNPEGAPRLAAIIDEG